MKKSIPNQGGAKISHYLGIDYGKSKIGLAIADEETRMAFALDTLKNDAEFLSKLKEIVESKGVKTIVLGMARHEKDQESTAEKMKFAKMLENELGRKVALQDEMFTTKMAQENIKKRGGKNIAKTDDQEAARIILESWLERKIG